MPNATGQSLYAGDYFYGSRSSREFRRKILFSLSSLTPSSTEMTQMCIVRESAGGNKCINVRLEDNGKLYSLWASLFASLTSS